MISIRQIALLRTSKQLTLRANFSWTLLGNVLYAVSQWGTIMIYTKSFSPETFGKYALGLSVSTPLFTFSTLQLRNIMVSERDEHTPPVYFFALRLITSLTAFIFLVSLCLLGVVPQNSMPITLSIGLGQGIVTVKDLFQGIMQRKERMDLVSVSLILQGGLSIICIFFAILAIESIFAALLAMALAEFIVLVAYDIPIATRLNLDQEVRGDIFHFGIKSNLKKILSLLRLSTPLGFVTLLIALQTSIPRYLMAIMDGEAASGYFTAVATFMALESLVVSALGQSSARRLTIHHANALLRYRRLLLKLMLLGILIGLLSFLGFALAGKEAIRLMFSAEYVSYYDVLLWLMIARIAQNVLSFMGYGMTAARYFKPSLWVYGFTTVTLALFSIILIPMYSGIGAAWSILFSTLVGVLIGLFVLRRELIGKGDIS